jgi:hypothetical protein
MSMTGDGSSSEIEARTIVDGNSFSYFVVDSLVKAIEGVMES